jgi:5-formyltetrahydrofolate cyclo-ligase
VIEAKAALRTRVLTARRAMAPDARVAAGAAISHAVLRLPEVTTAGTVAAYLSIGTEPSTVNLLEALRSRGVRVIVPVLRDDLDLEWAEYDGSTRLAQVDHGLLEPTGPRLGVDAIGAADVVVVPGLAADRHGVRLGRGGGSYDRALARVPPGRPVLVLLYDGEVLPAVPADPHDRRITAAVTPSGIMHF